MTETHGSASEVERLDRLALHLTSGAVKGQAMTKNCDLALTLQVGHNGLSAPAVMRLQSTIVDLEQTEARLLADGAKDSTLRELLTQRREGTGKHWWMDVDGLLKRT